MTETPTADALCGICRFPLSGYYGLRHFGTYTAHMESDCVALLRAALAARDSVIAEKERFWRKQIEEFQDALQQAEAKLAQAVADAERWRYLLDNVTYEDKHFGYACRRWFHDSGNMQAHTLTAAIDAARGAGDERSGSA